MREPAIAGNQHDCLLAAGSPCVAVAGLRAQSGVEPEERALWRLSHDCPTCPQLEHHAGNTRAAFAAVAKIIAGYIAERREPEQATRLRVQALEDIIRLSPDLIIAADMNGAITIFNKGAEELTGFREADMLGVSVEQLFDPGDVVEMMKRLYECGQFIGHKTHIMTRSCLKVPIEMSAAMIRSADGEPLYTVGISRDIRNRLRMEAQLTQLALTDPLTQLFNRRYFQEQLEREIEASRRYRSMLSLLLIDIDHFKRVNDSAGHAWGDRILQATAAVIRARLRGADMAFRVGGEEFAILAPRADANGSAVLAEDIRLRIRNEAHVTVSIGVATLTDGACSAQRLFEAADAQLYEAKRAGRDRVRAITVGSEDRR